MDDSVLTTALALTAAGFSVVPIKADKSKSPVGEWAHLQATIANPDEVVAMFPHDVGLAVINGAVSGNKETLDVDAPELVRPFESVVNKELPGLLDRLVVVATPRNNHGGRHYHYRCNVTIPGNRKLAMSETRDCLIETRGEGGYAIIPPSPGDCHETGLPYEYASVVELADCPVITAEEREALLTIARSFNAFIAEPVVHRPSQPGGAGNPGEAYNERATWEEILIPHGWIPLFTDGHGRMNWKRPGKLGRGTSATTGCISKSGQSLFCVFSSNAYPFDGADGDRPCSNYTKFGAFTLLNFQGDYSAAAGDLLGRGYGTPRIAPIDSCVDLTGILEPKAEPPLESLDSLGPFPSIQIPGLINEVVEYNLRTAMYPQPEMALAAAIALVATITGRKVRDTRGTRTNAYVLALAPSGSGKEHARKINKQILLHAGAEKMVGPERVASSAGLVSFVADQPAILFQLDEIGRLITTMQNPAKAPHLYNIGTVLMQLYSSSDSLWVSDAYADAKKTKRINQPHACIYGTSVPSGFWESLSSENVSDGLLGRLMVFEAKTNYVAMQDPKPEPVPQSIVDSVRQWIDLKTNSGNLSSENPTPIVATYSAEAQERLANHFAGIHERRMKEPDTTAAVWSRAGEKTSKLALIFACSRVAFWPPVVEIGDVENAIKISNWLTRRMLEKAADHISENETEGRSKRVLRLLSKPMTTSQITAMTRWLRARERMEILQDLIAAGLIVAEQKDTSGRPSTYYKRA